ncbi:MAG: peptidase S8, partial [Candidatus Aminicenantes bacterium]|nr:peptidase S8 [Candidatus Aminicenantes bacterium]
CLAVAATNYEDKRADWSNFGAQVDVAAPGVRVVGAVPTWYWGPGSIPYAFGYGTSLATPQVAGLAALLKGLKPWLSVDQIMDVIRYSADDVNSGEHPGRDDYVGYGRINMEKSLVPIKIKK